MHVISCLIANEVNSNTATAYSSLSSCLFVFLSDGGGVPEACLNYTPASSPAVVANYWPTTGCIVLPTSGDRCCPQVSVFKVMTVKQPKRGFI